MNREVITQFRECYESLAGHVRTAADIDEAGGILRQLLSEEKASRVAVGDFPEAVRPMLDEALSGLEVVAARELQTEVASQVDRADAGVCWAEFGIASMGTVVEATSDDRNRLVSSLPKVHVALLAATEIVATLEEAAPRLRQLFSRFPQECSISFVSGPSRTGDIEMKLVLGVHGPRASHVIVYGVPPG